MLHCCVSGLLPSCGRVYVNCCAIWCKFCVKCCHESQSHRIWTRSSGLRNICHDAFFWNFDLMMYFAVTC
jgi:hypothetical protein